MRDEARHALRFACLEAHLVAAACSAPPEGRARWTLKLLGDHLVGLGLVESISPKTVERTLKKTR